MHQDNDTQLMLKVAGGEVAHFRGLFERHYPRAVSIAYRSLGDMDMAEDTAMEAFARIYESRQTYSPKAKFSTFLFRVIVNLCLNASRRKRAVTIDELDESRVESPDSDPAVIVQRSAVGEAVHEAVLSLPGSQRVALVLTRYENMSYSEAAEAMGVSVKALESRLHRAKANLRKKLAGLSE
jgi:RNA polymerase sigma-70 factor (ECF subfamily)